MYSSEVVDGGVFRPMTIKTRSCWQKSGSQKKCQPVPIEVDVITLSVLLLVMHCIPMRLIIEASPALMTTLHTIRICNLFTKEWPTEA